MKKLSLDLESIAVETFSTGTPADAAAASVSRTCTLYNTCPNCTFETCNC